MLGDHQLCSETVATLASYEGGAQLDNILVVQLLSSVAGAWRLGWMPADVHRILSRTVGPRHARLSLAVMAAEASGWSDSFVGSLDPRWRAQLDSLHVPLRPGSDPVASWATAQGDSRPEGIRCAVECVAWLRQLAPLPRVCPAPGESVAARSAGPPCNTRILERVRALLAKAESTTFSEEAESLTAKAAELMARYAIDRAVLEHGDGSAPCAIRLPVDDPYANAKSLLLDKVGAANRCRAVWSQALGFATLFGFPAELEMVELLYTSLLVQATTALTVAGPQVDARGRSRTRSFRQSFLVAYAIRIGARLQVAAECGTTAAKADHGSSLLPVLAARDEAVDGACDAAFPGLVHRTLSVTNHSGWIAGHAAAELADMGVRREMEAPV